MGAIPSVVPTPVVAIGGEVYQQSGSERNIYEVFIQLSQLRFPKSEGDGIESLRKDGVLASPTQSFTWNLSGY